MSIPQHAVIAAAGFGSRLHKGMPKCLVDVNGHKIIEYQLALLRNIPDIRIVIGYHADEVVQFVSKIRSDVKYIRNDDFATTSTLQSYYMGCHKLHDFFILLDGDIIPQKSSFENFLDKFAHQDIIGMAPATTQDAVFIHVNDRQQVVEFTRDKIYPYEWSNIALLHSDHFINENIYVYQCVEKFLPVCAEKIERLEIDTAADMEYALNTMRQLPEEYTL